ncbi:MAG: 16S rRNA (guanine(527)-N(7))-methyltransferase RsmG [Hyphomicrobium sp.]
MAFQEAFTVSRETVARLETYAALLKRWQKTINLVSPSTVNDVWHRHFADSAQLWRLGSTSHNPSPPGKAEQRTHWADLGSGAGFPGLVLAIMAAEAGVTRHTLIESDTRKAAFLREVARETGVAVEIVAQRIELPQTAAKVAEVNCVTARALAPLPRLASLVAPLFGSGTIGLFLKGREVAAELDEARRDWEFDFQLLPSVTDIDARIVRLSGLRPKR